MLFPVTMAPATTASAPTDVADVKQQDPSRRIAVLRRAAGRGLRSSRILIFSISRSSLSRMVGSCEPDRAILVAARLGGTVRDVVSRA